MGLESSLRVMEKTTALEVMVPDEWANLMDVYTTMRRRHDPLCGPAKRFTILPVSLAASLALTRRHRDMLVALGRKAPRKWDAEVAMPLPPVIRPTRTMRVCATTMSTINSTPYLVGQARRAGAAGMHRL